MRLLPTWLKAVCNISSEILLLDELDDVTFGGPFVGHLTNLLGFEALDHYN